MNMDHSMPTPTMLQAPVCQKTMSNRPTCFKEVSFCASQLRVRKRTASLSSKQWGICVLLTVAWYSLLRICFTWALAILKNHLWRLNRLWRFLGVLEVVVIHCNWHLNFAKSSDNMWNCSCKAVNTIGVLKDLSACWRNHREELYPFGMEHCNTIPIQKNNLNTCSSWRFYQSPLGGSRFVCLDRITSGKRLASPGGVRQYLASDLPLRGAREMTFAKMGICATKNGAQPPLKLLASHMEDCENQLFVLQERNIFIYY